MARASKTDNIPACYAVVLPGLEGVAADEITRDVGGSVKKTETGLVMFRVPEIGPELLNLRTTEDVFLLAWGTDSLSYRATDLKQIRQWTSKEVDWQQFLRLHQFVRPWPKGRPSFHYVTQMTGTHGYRRIDAAKAMAQGLNGVFSEAWKPVEENALVEVWLTIHGRTAVCGLRLSDRTMRHRTWKVEHLPASLRPTIAAAMVRLAGAAPGDVVLDPLCGTGTILAEQIELSKFRKAGRIETWGGDHDRNALLAAATNLRKVGPAYLAQWDARALPLPPACVDRIVANPPFGKQLSSPGEIGPLYQGLVRECDRVVKPGGRIVLLVSDEGALRAAVRSIPWKPQRQLRVKVLGQQATINVWQKALPGGTVKGEPIGGSEY